MSLLTLFIVMKTKNLINFKNSKFMRILFFVIKEAQNLELSLQKISFKTLWLREYLLVYV